LIRDLTAPIEVDLLEPEIGAGTGKVASRMALLLTMTPFVFNSF